MERIVIAGAGLAGLRSAMCLREHGFTGSLVLVGTESARPYDRPPLSKEFLLRLDEDVDPELPADWDSLDVDLQLGRTVTGLRDGVVETDKGGLECNGVVVATGGIPKKVPGLSTFALRTLADARRVRKALKPSSRIVVVGAGWIGAEVATAAAAAGATITVIEQGELPLGQALPAEVASATRRWWEQAGVDLRTGIGIEGSERSGRGPTTLTLADGSTVVGDLLLGAVGVRPATDWLAGSGIALGDDGGVLTDAGLRTNVGGVVAVGDVAAWESRRYARRLRVEHWDTALHGPVVAAANLLSAPGPGEPPTAVYDPVPYFWSQQFGHNLQLVGYPPAGSSVVWRGDPAGEAGWAVGWFADDRLVAVLAVDVPRDIRQAKRLLESGEPVDRDRFADPGVALKDVAAAGAGQVVASSSS